MAGPSLPLVSAAPPSHLAALGPCGLLLTIPAPSQPRPWTTASLGGLLAGRPQGWGSRPTPRPLRCSPLSLCRLELLRHHSARGLSLQPRLCQDHGVPMTGLLPVTLDEAPVHPLPWHPKLSRWQTPHPPTPPTNREPPGLWEG